MLCKRCEKKHLLCTADIVSKVCPACKNRFMASSTGYKYCNHCLVCRVCGVELKC
jgi:hypothetical protein